MKRENTIRLFAIGISDKTVHSVEKITIACQGNENIEATVQEVYKDALVWIRKHCVFSKGNENRGKVRKRENEKNRWPFKTLHSPLGYPI